MHLCIPLLSILLSKGTWLKPPQATFTLSCHSMTCSRYGFHTDRSCFDLRLGFRCSPSLFLLMDSQVILTWTRNPPFLISKNYLFGCLTTPSTTLFLKNRETFFAVRRGHDPLTLGVTSRYSTN